LQSPISLNIHNQCQDINMISSVHFIHGGKWHVVPVWKIDINAVMRNRLKFDAGQDILEGALLYKVQRIHYGKSHEFVQDKSKCTQLLVAWRIEHTKEPHVRALLVEHDRESNWDEDKLIRLYQKYWHLLRARLSPIGFNWLLDDATVLNITIKVMNGGYRWDIFISEGNNNYFDKPLWIDTER
jgi:hypothetical protein